MSGFPSYCWRLLQCKYRGEEISEHIEDATVYLDAGCTESFEFLGAYPLLLELGAHAVCSLENMSSLDMVPCVTCLGLYKWIMCTSSKMKQIRDLIWTCLVIWRADGSSFCVFVHITLHVFWLCCKFYIFVSITRHIW
ncbi:hypothetical protein ACSBR1_016247 [Camellia fascicularis]